MSMKAFFVAAVVAASPIAVSATTVNIDIRSFGSIQGGDLDKAGALTALNTFVGTAPRVVTEDFSGFTACTGSNADSCGVAPQTSVGDFSVFGSGGSGASVVAAEDNVVVRSTAPGGNMFGRFGVLGTETHWLDSNDNPGIDWAIPGASNLSNIVRLAFFLTDVQDVNNFQFGIGVAGSTITSVMSMGEDIWNARRPNGELILVTMDFSQSVNDLNIQLRSGAGRTNDGFGVAGVSIAAVPLPAGGLLLISALGGMAFLRRRKAIQA